MQLLNGEGKGDIFTAFSPVWENVFLQMQLQICNANMATRATST